MKKCSYCAEQIQDEAILCRFCGKNISTNIDTRQSGGSDKPINLGNILVLIGGILGEVYALYIVASEWGFIGAIAAFMFFPVAIITAPFYALIVYGVWFPLVIVYGLIGLGVIISSRSED